MGHLLDAAAPAGALVVFYAGQRCHFGLEPSLVDSRDGPLVAGQGEGLHLVTRDVPLFGDQFGAPELGNLLGAVAVHPSRRAGEWVVMAEGPGRLECRGDGNHAHVLHAARHDQVLEAGHHAHGGEADRLLARPALTVDGGTGDGLGKAGGQPCRASDVTGLRANVVDAAEDHVVDGHRVQVVALHHFADDVGAEVGRVHLGQAASPLAGGGPDGVDDISLGHGSLLVSSAKRLRRGTVGDRYRGSRGKPRTRSPITLRWIWLEPP